MALPTENLRIAIDGKWDLNDLHGFSYAYSQVYSLLYSLTGASVQTGHPATQTSIDSNLATHQTSTSAYKRYPWRGGYSAFDFYQELYFSIPEENRPQVKSISYASPGWLELTLVAAIALSIEKIVKSIAKSVDLVDATYDRHHARAQKRKLLRATTRNEELKLSVEDLKFLREASEEVARLMGFTSLDELHAKTGDPLVSFKILMSFYRRVRPLVSYQERRQIDL